MAFHLATMALRQSCTHPHEGASPLSLLQALPLLPVERLVLRSAAD